MDYKFKKEDIGKRVLLLINLEKISGDSFFNEEGGYEKIPYESIIDYSFLFQRQDKFQTKIIDTGKTARKINPFFIGKSLGASKMSELGEIIDISEDYLKIKKLSNYESSKLIKGFYPRI